MILDGLWRSATRDASNNAQQLAAAAIKGRHLRFEMPGEGWHADLPYLEADVTARAPGRPLNVNDYTSFDTHVKAARVELDQAQLDRAVTAFVRAHPGQVPLADPKVKLVGSNRVQVEGRLAVANRELPVSVRAKVSGPDAATLSATPEDIRVMGLPVLWLLKLLKLSPARLVDTRALPVAFDGLSARLDITRLPRVKAELTGVEIAAGRASVTLGGTPGADLARGLRGNNPHYAHITTRGEVGNGEAALRDGELVLMDDTPADPLALPNWQPEATARVHRGDVVIPESTLVQRLQPAGGFTPRKARLEGTQVVVEGEQEVLGEAVPVSAKVNVQRSAAGNLQLVPTDVRALGLPVGIGPVKARMLDEMGKVSGLRKIEGGVVVDPRAAAKVELPPVKRVRGEQGSLVVEL